MADVLISYSERDRHVAQQLAEFLSGVGRTVWWETTPPNSPELRHVRTTEIANARVVIVLWSKSSLASPFVLQEAIAARDVDKALHVKTPDVQSRQVPVRRRGEPLFDASDFMQVALAVSTYCRS